jgi:hypothetical protein
MGVQHFAALVKDFRKIRLFSLKLQKIAQSPAKSA